MTGLLRKIFFLILGIILNLNEIKHRRLCFEQYYLDIIRNVLGLKYRIRLLLNNFTKYMETISTTLI